MHMAGAMTRFAVIGDFGSENSSSARGVANRINAWGVDFIVTVGDNNYCTGAQYAVCVGAYYSPSISLQAFWPALGNHDWDAGVSSYTSYFNYLPGNKRYYDFVRGNVHFFIIDSDPREPDGVTSDSAQGQWLHTQLTSATEPWRVVVFHHPPYSGGLHGSSLGMRWPFKSWGATAVLTGHDHTYERLEVDGLPYFVDGLGGRSIYSFIQGPLPETRVRFNADYGALLVEVSTCQMTFRFITQSGQEIDSVTQDRCPATPVPTTSPTRAVFVPYVPRTR